MTPRARPLGPALEHAQNAVLTDSVTSVGTVYVIGPNAWYDDGETFVEWPEFLGFEAPEGDRARFDGNCSDEVSMKPRHKLSRGMLLAVMRGCAAENSVCKGCPLDGMMMPYCHDWLVTAAADLIEELTTWRDPANDPPTQFEPVLVCRIKDPGKPPIVEQGYRDVGGWWKVYGTRVKKIIGWMPMPKGADT